MSKESDDLSWEIPKIGWGYEHRDEIIKSLNEFSEKSASHLLEISLEEYAEGQGKNTTDYETKEIQGYCAFYMTKQVRMDLCLLTVDGQRQNLEFEAVVGLNYEINLDEVTLKGIAVRLKK